jgi:hypothetical protein
VKSERWKQRLGGLVFLGPCFSGALGSNNDGTKPSEECKAAVFQALYEWFKETRFTNLNRNYLALGRSLEKRRLEAANRGFLKTPFLERSGTRTDESLATLHEWRTSF